MLLRSLILVLVLVRTREDFGWSVWCLHFVWYVVVVAAATAASVVANAAHVVVVVVVCLFWLFVFSYRFLLLFAYC